MDTKALEEEHERLKDELATIELNIEKANLEYKRMTDLNFGYDIRTVICENPILECPMVVTMEIDMDALAESMGIDADDVEKLIQEDDNK